MLNQAFECNLDQTDGEIIDNQTQEVVKKLEYNPPE